jgi:cardiolipin synthase
MRVDAYGMLTPRHPTSNVATGPLLATALVCAAAAVVAVLWPASIGWPFGALAGWTALNLGIRSWRLRGRHRREGERDH